MPLQQTQTALMDLGRAFEKLISTLPIKKAAATKHQQFAARKAFRDAAGYLRKAGFTQKDERDDILKPYGLAYDPNHRTR